MDEFLIVLGVALLILVVAGFFFTSTQTIETVPQNISVLEFSLGIIGLAESVAPNTLSIGSFTAGTTQLETLESVPQLVVSAGLFSSDQKNYSIKIGKDILPSLEKVNIRFEVKETNLYSDLTVKWNGRSLLAKKAEPGIYTLYAKRPDVLESNFLELSTSANPVFFWASSTYLLENFTVDQEYGSARVVPFSMSLKDIESLEKAEITFFSGSRTASGSLILRVNGREVFNKFPQRVEAITLRLNDTRFTVGTNSLSFLANNGLFDLENVELKLYTRATNVVKKRLFTITDSTLGNLEKRNGTLEVRVDRVVIPGDLKVQLNSREFEVLPDTGQQSFIFYKSDLKAGENELLVSSTGSFDIARVRVIV